MCIRYGQPLISITQIQYINVQKTLVVTFEFTGAARGFMIMSCAARGVKKVGQHRTIYLSICKRFVNEQMQNNTNEVLGRLETLVKIIVR